MTAREPAFPLQIAKPCPKTWSELEGGEQRRFCSACSLHVHDAAALSRDEAGALVTNASARVCMRIRFDARGAPIFRTPEAAPLRPLERLTRWALATAAGVLAACHGSLATPSTDVPSDPNGTTTPSGTGTEHTTELLGDVAVPTPPPEILGEVALPQPEPTPRAPDSGDR